MITFKSHIMANKPGEISFNSKSRAKTGTAGIPGFWSPAGSLIPFNGAEANAWAITPIPATVWTPGQHIIGSTGMHIYWSGVSWVNGDSP
jgi:hypothetical protein